MDKTNLIDNKVDICCREGSNCIKRLSKNNKPIQCFGASLNENELIWSAASGGIFSAIALQALKENAIVFGAALVYKEDKLAPNHIYIQEAKDLYKLQGSKYVQSYIGACYIETKKFLDDGKFVIFSGTPCQIDGLYNFLNKDYENLLTIDIVCHGVPNAKMFQDYIKVLEKKLNGTIIDFKFRDKTFGWGLTGKAIYRSYNGKIKYKIIPSNISSYYRLFLSSAIYRENCYSCPYTSSNRPADITLGDYWGIQQKHPEAMLENGGNLSDKRGVSCIMVNSERGSEYLEKVKPILELVPSSFKNISEGNEQLRIPSHRSADRETILELYRNCGYEAVDKKVIGDIGYKYYLVELKYMLKEFKEKNYANIIYDIKHLLFK